MGGGVLPMGSLDSVAFFDEVALGVVDFDGYLGDLHKAQGFDDNNLVRGTCVLREVNNA